MDPAIASLVRCPRCGAPVEDADAGVRCEAGHEFRWHDGYLDFGVDADDVTTRTLESFGFEWTAFDRIQPEDEGYWRWYFEDVPLGELSGVVALDAGCGKGRFTRFTAPHVRAIVALDGSAAVEAAARNLAPCPNATVIRSDLRRAPFSEGAFGFISCLGVLHHLPDPAVGFRGLARLLEPGGRLLVYVYSRPSGRGVRALGLRAAALLRRVTLRFPHPLLRALSAPIAAGLYVGVVLPGAWGARRHVRALTGLPLNAYRGRPLRALWLDTFDRLSAPLEARYRPHEVEAWFSSAGLHVDAVREDAGIFVLGHRPAPEAA